MNAQELARELELLIRSRYTHIWVETWEEERVLEQITVLARRLNKEVITWSISSGFDPVQPECKNPHDNRTAIDYVRNCDLPAIFVFLDYHRYVGQYESKAVRAIRETARASKKSKKNLIFIAPEVSIPLELEKSATILSLSLPDEDELGTLLHSICASVDKNSKLKLDMTPELHASMVQAARGLTLQEAEAIFTKAAVSDRSLDASDLTMIINEKKQILRKTGVLEFVETPHTMDGVGGLDRLKHWLKSRSGALSPAAQQFGLPSPKGLLLLGVQGCGKSLVAKSVSHSWQMPLLKLDIGSLFSSYIGSTEANMRSAIRLAESIAPAVLWIDEIEKGLSGLQSSGSVDAGVTARVFASFLSWMQEKTAPVFVIATSNDISQMPPELLRKGRVDEIFFIDLPTDEERKKIFSIHLSSRKRDPQYYDLQQCVEASKGFSGAEIEQAIVAALYMAYAEGRELLQQDILSSLNQSIPLSRTMKEQLSSLRSWAVNRAVPAS